MQSKRYNASYIQSMLSYLDKNVRELREPMDIVRAFAPLTAGQQHQLNRGIRAFLKFEELKGFDSEYINGFRKAIPKDNVGIDLRIPTESEILASMRKLNKLPLKYRALFSLLLDSGLRLVEAAKLLNHFENPTKVQRFYRCTLGYFRSSKLAYVAYFTDSTLELIQGNHDQVNYRTATSYYRKFKYVMPKYIRKFAFDTMLSEKLNIPESVADFIQGRVPQKIGARHYTALLRQADNYYGRYADYLGRLRSSTPSLSAPTA